MDPVSYITVSTFGNSHQMQIDHLIFEVLRKKNYSFKKKEFYKYKYFPNTATEILDLFRGETTSQYNFLIIPKRLRLNSLIWSWTVPRSTNRESVKLQNSTARRRSAERETVHGFRSYTRGDKGTHTVASRIHDSQKVCTAGHTKQDNNIGNLLHSEFCNQPDQTVSILIIREKSCCCRLWSDIVRYMQIEGPVAFRLHKMLRHRVQYHNPRTTARHFLFSQTELQANW